MSAYKEYRFSDLIEEVEERNISLVYGLDDIVGVTIEKGLIPTIANLTQTALDKFYIVKPDTFVYNPRTHGVRLGMGYNDTNKTFLTSWNNVAFRVKEDAKKIVLSKYLWIYFNRPEWDRQTNFMAWGSSTIVFAWNDFLSIKIQLPDLKEQEKIVNTYNAITKRIQLKQKINENLEKTAQCLFENVFKHELQKEEISFTDVIDLLGGGTPSTAEKSYWSGNIPFFAPADIEKSIFCFSTEKNLTEEGLNNCSSKLYPKNTTFVTCRGTVGKLALAGTPMAMNQSCYALKDKNGQYPFFTYSFAKFTVSKLKNKASGAVFSALVTKDFEMEKVFNPNLEKMKEYETKSSSIFENISSNEKEIAKLKELKQLVISRISGM